MFKKSFFVHLIFLNFIYILAVLESRKFSNNLFNIIRNTDSNDKIHLYREIALNDDIAETFDNDTKILTHYWRYKIIPI